MSTKLLPERSRRDDWNGDFTSDFKQVTITCDKDIGTSFYRGRKNPTIIRIPYRPHSGSGWINHVRLPSQKGR